MPNSFNIKTVKNLTDRLKDAKSIVFIDYKGINVDEVDKLRSKMREANVDYFVAKNTLIRLALNDLNLEELVDTFKGPTAVAVSKEDEVAPARELRNFVKENMKDKDFPSFKDGVINGRYYKKDDIVYMSQLPSKDQLISEVLSGINAPISGFVFTLKGIIDSLVYVVQGISDNK